MHRIGEFSKLGKTTVKTLRYYDEVGLLSPAEVDPWTGYRYYSTAQLFELQRIVSLRQIGLGIEDISAVLSGQAERSLLERRRAELAAQHATLGSQLSRLDHYLTHMKEGLAMSYDVIVKDTPGCSVFSARRVIPNYEAMGTIVPEIGAKIAAENPEVCCPENGYCCNIFHDGEYKETEIDVEVCQEVNCCGRDGEGYVFKTLPSVTVASVLHRGPFSAVGAAYAYLFDWIEQNGYQVADSPRESYLDGPWNKDDEADYLTEVQVPITPAAD